MGYHLAANRIMGLCAFELNARGNSPSEPRDAKTVAKVFYRQLEELSKTRLERIYAAIKTHTERMGTSLFDENIDESDLEVTVFQDNGTDKEFEQLFPVPLDRSSADWPRDPIIGLFRPRRFRLEIGAMVWDLRVRPSVTACLLESEDRLSKLWWTFDGVPVDSSHPPTEDDTVRFMAITTKLAEAALPDLREAYTATLASVLGRSRGAHRMAQTQLRVSLADNTDAGFSRLVDAMNIAGVTFKDAVAAKAGSDLRAGADEVVDFITKTSGRVADADSITLARGKGGDVAVFTKPISEGNSRRHPRNFVMSGLASSFGMISNSLSADPEWTGLTTTPDLVRSISAARPLSARLADIGARRLDQLHAIPA